MNLILDIGNTGAKAAVYNNKLLVRKERLERSETRDIKSFIGTSDIHRAMISSVAPDPAVLVSYLSSSGIKTHHLTYRSKYPFAIEYKTPDTLGVDRLAAAAGAIMHHPGHDLLIIDAGSAVTLDVVSGGSFLGGSISPGMGLRFRALNQFTGRLPLVTYTDEFSFPGNTTSDAIAGGVFMGLVFEINEYIRRFEKRYNTLITVITGGDGGKIAPVLDSEVHLYHDLVTEGLNYLLEYNV